MDHRSYRALSQQCIVDVHSPIPSIQYYSILISAETFGPNGNSQILDLNANNMNEFTPAYAIYEDGNIARVALFHYMTDQSGANSYTATISIGGGQTGAPNGTPAQVKVK